MPHAPPPRSGAETLIYSERMARLLVFGVVAAVVLTVYAIVDCALTERRAVRALPRWTWLLVIVVVPLAGPLLWLVIGHVRSTPRRIIPPDDNPEFIGRPPGPRPAPTRPDDEEIRLLEQELANLDSEADDDGDGRRRG